MAMSREMDSGRAAFWRKLIDRRRRSGVSVEHCCAEAGVSPASFYQWQRKFRSDGAARGSETAKRPADSRLVPVHIIEDRTIRRCDGASDVLEVELPGEIRLRIPAGYDAATLRLIVSVLREGGEEDRSC
jgi:transposase-like protein